MPRPLDASLAVLALAAVALLGAANVQAATLDGVRADGTIALSGVGNLFNAPGASNDFSVNVVFGGASSGVAGDPTGFNINFTASAGGALTNARFLVSQGANTLLASNMQVDVAFTEDPAGADLIEVLFSDLTGTLANGAFAGGPALLSLAGEFGADPFAVNALPVFVSGAALTINPTTVVPLPAALSLSLAGLGALWAIGRRRAGV